MSLKRQFATSSLWTVGAAVFNNLSTMVVFVALARLLTPVEFGTVAFATVFVEISRVIVIGGVPDALIQRRDWDENVATTAFWVNMLAGLAICILLGAIAAPLVGRFYDSTFAFVLAALSAILLVEGATAVHVAKLRREFKHKVIAQRQMATNIVSGFTGVALAYSGFGVWALVISRLFAATSTSIILWNSTSFRPRLHFSMEEFRGFSRFARHQLGSQLLSQGNAQITSLMIGFLLGPAAIAQYRVGSRALNMMVSLVITPLQSAAMSAFSRLNRQEGAIASAYLRLTRTCALVACPVFFGMAATAPDLVLLIFGPQWAEGAKIMTALALVVGPATLSYFQGPALSSAGRTGLTFWTNATAFAGNVIVAIVAAPFGAIYVAAGHTARAHITVPLSIRLFGRSIGLSPWRSITNVAPPYLCAAAMAAVVTFLRLRAFEDLPTAARFSLCVLAGPPLYGLFLWLFARRFLVSTVGELTPLLPSRMRRFVPPLFLAASPAVAAPPMAIAAVVEPAGIDPANPAPDEIEQV